jgi:tRNA nucleotidyltransferase/poly(A) polymerase
MKIYLVGGAVRDKLMGKTPKDFDYSVVMTNGDHCDLQKMNRGPNNTKLIGPKIDFFTFMGHKLRKEGYKVFVMTPEHMTIRAHFPKSHENARQTADFVLARKESGYSDGRRPDSVEVGTLTDDLSRRDFTMNAIAEDLETGEIIDPFAGRKHIADGVVVPVGNGKERMMEDSLRVLRALRFKIQLDFILSRGLDDLLFDTEVLAALRNVSDERKMDELNKMFRADSLRTLRELNQYYALGGVVFAGKVNLEATMKTKGFK